jgi:hypothetical protein
VPFFAEGGRGVPLVGGLGASGLLYVLSSGVLAILADCSSATCVSC